MKLAFLRLFVCALAIGTATAVPAPVDVAYLALTKGQWQVWVMRDDGTQSREVTRSLADKTRVSWFPSGDRLLVDDNQGGVSVVELASGRETPVEFGVRPVLDAVLSPDGTRIAFSFNGAESRDGHDLWIAASNGTGRRRVTDMTQMQHEPTWSPDGQSLYFLSGGGGQAHDIWRLDLRTGAREQLTVADLYHFDVAVSVQGDLAFSGNRSGNYEIYLQHPGETAVALTDDPGLDAHPTFSADGQEILFESSRTGSVQIWKMRLATRALTQITHHKGGARAPVWLSSVGVTR